jgi:hypothetical protein
MFVAASQWVHHDCNTWAPALFRNCSDSQVSSPVTILERNVFASAPYIHNSLRKFKSWLPLKWSKYSQNQTTDFSMLGDRVGWPNIWFQHTALLHNHSMTSSECCAAFSGVYWYPRQQIILPSFLLVSCLADFRPSRWRWYVPPKRLLTYVLHSAISQKMATFKFRLISNN